MKRRPRGLTRNLRLIRQLTFASHDPVLRDGVYRVIHNEHRLAAEVTLLEGNEFPTCSRCEKDVFFEFLRPVNPAPGFQVVLYSLPEIQDSDEGALPGSHAA